MLHKRQAFCCPCCGGYIGEAAPIADVIARMTGHKQSVVKALSQSRGMMSTRGRLIETMWSGAKEPKDVISIFNVVIYRTKVSIELYGWTIATPGRGGDEAIYRLIPLEAGA